MKRSNYITRAGWDTLERELKFLWKEERPRVTQAVSEAAALGDRSENAEYIYGKRRLREIDRRVRFLDKRLEVLQIVEYSPQQEGKVYFGAYVELENDDGDILCCRVVGSDEIDTKKNYITIDSPMARALIGKEVDDDISVETPSGVKEWFINKIQYQPFEKNN